MVIGGEAVKEEERGAREDHSYRDQDVGHGLAEWRDAVGGGVEVRTPEPESTYINLLSTLDDAGAVYPGFDR